MKIIFTSKGEDWSCKIDPRFGRADLFVSFNEETNELSSISNAGAELMEHGAGLQTSKKVLDLNPDVIITGNGAGEKALAILKKSNVEMYIGAEGMSLKEAYEAYKNNKLEKQF